MNSAAIVTVERNCLLCDIFKAFQATSKLLLNPKDVDYHKMYSSKFIDIVPHYAFIGNSFHSNKMYLFECVKV